MFLSRIVSVVSGRTGKAALKSCAPDGRVVAVFHLACGNGSVKFPLMWVKVCVWEALAEKALSVLDKKGLNVEAAGYLVVVEYEGKYGKSVLIELKDVRELKLFDRDGELLQVITGA